MATPKVLLKRSSVVGRTPTSADLDFGELAINFADGKIHYKDANNNIKSFIDSAIVNDLITKRSTDSAEVLAIVQANSLDSSETLDLIYKNSLDSAEVSRLITTQALDSADAILLIDSSHVQLKQSYNATQLNSQAPSYYLDYTNFTNTPNVLDSADIISVALDSAEILAIVDSNHVQLKQSYNALTLEGQNLSYVRNYNNLQNTPVILDLVDISNHVDSAYVRLRVQTDQDLNTTDNVTFNQIRGPENFIIDPAAVGDNTGTVQILGNLQVQGEQTTINSTTVSINDKNLLLADSAANAAAADGAGITIGGANATLTYNAAGDKFVFNKPIDGDYHGFDSDFDSALALKTTTNVAEGTNLYYTKARADSDIASSLNDSGNTVNISISTTITSQVDSAYVLARVGEAPFLDSGNATNLINAAYIETNRPAETIINIVSNGGNYDFTGDGFPTTSTNPTLYLTRGLTYKLNVNASGHPFNINTQNTTGTGSLYNSGVTNNGTTSGSILFTVPMNAPNTLHYNCQYHGGMNGPIYVLDRDGRLDSAEVISLIDNNSIDSAEVITLIDNNSIDSVGVATLINVAYIQSRQLTYDFLDSAEAINLIDSSYVQARQSTTTPTITIQDSGSTLTSAASTLNFVGPGVTASGTGSTKTITINATGSGGVDSASTINLIDSAYVQARQLANFILDSAGGLTALANVGVVVGDHAVYSNSLSNNSGDVYYASRLAQLAVVANGQLTPASGAAPTAPYLYLSGTNRVTYSMSGNILNPNGTEVTGVSISFSGTGVTESALNAKFPVGGSVSLGIYRTVLVCTLPDVNGTDEERNNVDAVVIFEPTSTFSGTTGTFKITGFIPASGGGSVVDVAGNSRNLIGNFYDYTRLLSRMSEQYIFTPTGNNGTYEIASTSSQEIKWTKLGRIDSSATTNLIDSAYVQARTTSGGGGTITEVSDSSAREAIATPLEGDVAVQFQTGPGVSTGITHNYSNGSVMTYSGGSGTTYNNGQQTFTSSVFGPHAQVGDVIVVENSSITADNGYTQSGTLITAVCELIDNTSFKVMHTFGWYWGSQPGGTGGHPAGGLVNRALKNYFDNASNPRGDIPNSAVAVGAGGGNPHASGFYWTGGVATLYRMFSSIQSVFQANPSSGFTNGAPHAYNDITDGTVTASIPSKPLIWFRNDSAWKPYINDQIVGTIDSAYIQARQLTYDFLDSAEATNLIDSSYIQSRQSTTTPTITIQDEGSALSTAASTLNFVGASVTASGTGATKTITITSEGGVDSAATIALIDARIDSGRTPLTQQVFTFTADSATDFIFTGADDNSQTLTYTASKLSVFLNGILLIDSVDYTAQNGTSITLLDSAQNGDVISAMTFLGNTGLDSAKFQGIIDSNFLQVPSHLIPNVDSTYNLGSPTKQWKDLYLSGNTIHLGGHRIHTNSSGIRIIDSLGAEIALTASNILDSSNVIGIIGSETLDSALIVNLVDSAYIQLRDRFQDSSGILAIVDSAYVQARTGGGGGGGGGTITEVTDSTGREAISSPLEGDVAVQFQSGPGRNTGVTHNFGGATIVSWSVGANYTGGELTLNNSTFAAAAQPGDVIVVSSGTVQRYNSYHTVNSWQTQQSGNLIIAVKSITDANNLQVLLAVPVYWSGQGTTGYMNTNLKAYFDNASNPRGEIPGNAVVAYSGDPNVNGTTGSQKLTGTTATLYRMFEKTIKSTWDTSGITSTPINTSDNYQGEVTALTNSNPLIWFRNDSAWKPYINDQITGTIDSAYTRNLIDSAYVSSLKFIQNTTITEVSDSDQRVAISSSIEGDVAIQFRGGTGTSTGISHDFSGAQLWSKTVYLASGTNSLSYTSANDVGNGRFKWSHSTFDNHVQKGDVIVVENATVTTSPGVNPWASKSGTLMFACHTPKVGSTAPWYNIVAYFYDVPNGSAGYMNTDLGSYFSGTDGVATTTNPRGSIPAAAVMVHSYGNVNNSSATTTLVGGVATLYRMFDGTTYQDAYDTSGGGGGTAYTDQTGTVNAIGGLKPLVYHYNDAAFKPYVQNNILGTVDSAYINARVDPFDSSHVLGLVDSAYIQLRDRFQDSSGILAIVDSAYVQARTTAGTDSAATISLITSTIDSAYVVARAGGAGGGLDSAKAINLIDSDYIGTRVDFTRGEFKTSRSQYTATSNQTVFNHTTLDASNLDVYINGILQVVNVDYTATKTAVTFTSGLTTGFSVTIVERRGRVATQQGLIEAKYYYTTPTPSTSITGTDDNGVTLDYSIGGLDVYLNGILLKDSDDYSTNAGSAVTLVSSTDSNDIVTLINRKGVTVTPNVVNYEFTATASQTLFSGSDINSNTLSYVPDAIQVYLNGILLRNTDFTAINGSSIQLLTAATVNDELVVSAFSNPGQNMELYKFTADSNQTIFNGNDLTGASLAYQPSNIQVFMNGLLLNDSDDYIASNGTSVVLTSAANLLDEIKIASFVTNTNNIRTNPWTAPSGTPIAASAGDKLFIDTSTAKTITLPSVATMGQEIRIIDVTGNASSNNIIINRNGHKIQGSATNFIINLDRSAIGLVYYNVAQGWVLTEN